MSMRGRHALLGLLTLALTAAVYAADDSKVIYPAGTVAPGAAAATAGSPLNTMTLVLGLALAGVGGWLVWRNRRLAPAARDVRALAIDETRSLGNRQYLVVASYAGKKFLLGVCPGRINLLTGLPDESDDEDELA